MTCPPRVAGPNYTISARETPGQAIRGSALLAEVLSPYPEPSERTEDRWLKTCDGCGARFGARRDDARYCGDSCRKRASRRSSR
jgi:hypothetical protein